MQKECDITTLSNIIKDDLIREVCHSSQTENICLTEKDISLQESGHGISYSVTINKVPLPCVVIKPEAFSEKNTLFKGRYGECKCADYCLITSTKDYKVIVYIELKYGSDKSKIINQLKGAKCIISYCKSVVSEFCGNSTFLDGYEERYVCIRNINRSISKQPTRQVPVDNTKPENFLSIEGIDNVMFSRCIQKH